MLTFDELYKAGIVQIKHYTDGAGVVRPIYSTRKGMAVEFNYNGKYRFGTIDFADFQNDTITVEFFNDDCEVYYRQFKLEKIRDFQVMSILPA